MRRSLEVVAGIRAALSTDPLDRSWFEAVTDTEDQAQAMHNLHMAENRACGNQSPPFWDE